MPWLIYKTNTISSAVLVFYEMVVWNLNTLETGFINYLRKMCSK